MRKIKLVEVRSEIAAGTRGASLGIDALKIASLDKKSNFFSRFDPINVPDANSYLWKGNKHSYAKYIDGVYQILKNVYSTIELLRMEKKFPIILAGDHSTAAGTIMGIKSANPEKRLGVIWIDAHADLHTPYTTPSGNMHGMPLAMCLQEDNKDCQINEIPDETIQYWEKIKKIGGDFPKMNAKDIVFITVRDTEEPEDHLIQKYGIKNFKTEEVRSLGVPEVARQALEVLKDCEQIYISFDVDSLDSSISVGTGTPVANGLTVEEAIELNTTLIKDKRVCCWEIVEVNPTLDTENLMAENAFDILEATTKSLVDNF
ncbi:arginase [Rhodonellum psychrophilum GCM71 = DSM 17998]|uniref:Arginase n=2 Tax=Rhodonellum TaxID=336827 RepID=U5BSV0_9BACT|nr:MULTISPECIES: arginase [Rhodonellum]ERM80963.1 arginase [Rhodonellum psychrophilum GCM71 = DSM 17998]MDO9554741.1 arginase [Rhodonellum sp.]SDY82218.1 arginase [Rhodonellum ikkaensis]